MLGSSITQLILYPSYENPITVMTGIQTGAPTVRGRKPHGRQGAAAVSGPCAGPAREPSDLRYASRRSPAPGPTIRTHVRDRLGDRGDVLEIDEL
ncbi:MAG: hypothetical protein U5L06_00565 [Rhodovibrio sp.]|nr:hypothetical protein [Rhodovibrio sp.]